MIKDMRYAAGASCVAMRLNAARMPKLWAQLRGQKAQAVRPAIGLWRISPASEAPGSVGQMSRGNNMGVFEWSYITNSVGGEEVEAASRFELHTFSI